VKAAFSDVARINQTMSAVEGADAMEMNDNTVVDVITGLRASDFDKSMRSEINPAVRQDVYKPIIAGRQLYVKFTRDARGNLLLISFKENEP